MSGTKPASDAAVAVNYIRENFEPGDRLAVVVLNKRTRSVTQRIAAAETIMEPHYQDWLRNRNDRERCEIYISMNALHPNAQGRTKKDIAAIRHIYLDFDLDGSAALERLLKRPDLPKPNYLINSSSDKWQVVWKVDGIGKEQAEQLQRGLARDVGADPAATDCARVLRLPGFYNHKYAPPYLIEVELLTHDASRPEHFQALQMPRPPGPGDFRAPVRRIGAREGSSQSEKDWAYAKRALARGESPAAVVDAIVSYRRFDKHNPTYYADLTVTKAMEALRTECLRVQPKGLEPER